jgi:formylglycine-generating enzyme required for sulfatase activity/serine/threonine protein kinase/Tol biopolymer transport system component
VAEEKHCSSASRLHDLLEGALTEEQEQELATHLEECRECSRRFEELAGQAGLPLPPSGEISQGEDESQPALHRVIEELAANGPGETAMPTRSSTEDVPLDFLAPSDRSDALGRLGHYEILEVLGQGGMGLVLRALDAKLNRVVAIKTLAPLLAANATARRRFLREARAAAAITHPHVVMIHAVDDEHETVFLVMECVEGKTLREKIEQEGALKLVEILRIGSQVAQGLAAAHEQGLIHRDVKPANILLENGIERVKITDFGLARAVDDFSITKTGEVAGTPEFMSPEQAQGERIDHRSDLFSLGSVLYMMCTGRGPFRADSSLAIVRRVCDDVPRPIREVNSEIPDWLVEIIDRLLEKDPENRLQSAREVAELLGSHLACLQNATDTPPPRPLPKRPVDDSGPPSGSPSDTQRRSRWSAASTALVAVAVLLGACLTLVVTELTGVTHLADFFNRTDSPAVDLKGPQVPPRTDGLPAAVEPGPIFSPTEILTSDEWEWTEPVNLGANVNSEHLDGAPELSADGLTLIFVSDRPGGEGDLDLWMSTRDSVDAPWSTAVNLGPTVNGTNGDAGPSLATDGLTLIYASSGRPGGQGHWDLWRCTRPSRNDSWSEPVNLGYELNTRTAERDPALSADGLTLLFSASSAGEPSADLAISRRASRQDAWSRPIRLSPEINSESADVGPTLSADGLTLIFASTRPGGFGAADLWLSSRTSPTEAWSKPINLGAIVNQRGHDTRPTLSADGRTLIFEGGRTGTIGGHDLWMSRRVRKSADDTARAEGEPDEREPPGLPAIEHPADAPPLAIAPFDAATAKKHQQAWAEYLDLPVEQDVDLGDGVKLKMVLIPPGEFLMGSTAEQQTRFLEKAKALEGQLGVKKISSEGPQHWVRITKPFGLGRHEVTRGQFRRFVEETGYKTEAERDGKGGGGLVDGKWIRDPRFLWSADQGFPQTDDHPVVNVSWDDAVAFCQWLSKKEGVEYALPTEAQWEYACRAGTTTAWYYGDGHKGLQEYAWFGANADKSTHPTGQLKPNAYGLYDMYGNAWEWCADWFGEDYYDQSPPNDPSGPPAGLTRVNRGDRWGSPTEGCRSASRHHRLPRGCSSDVGFRLASVLVDE